MNNFNMNNPICMFPKINKVVIANQIKELIKKAVKDQVDCVTQLSHTYDKSYS